MKDIVEIFKAMRPAEEAELEVSMRVPQECWPAIFQKAREVFFSDQIPSHTEKHATAPHMQDNGTLAPATPEDKLAYWDSIKNDVPECLAIVVGDAIQKTIEAWGAEIYDMGGKYTDVKGKIIDYLREIGSEWSAEVIEDSCFLTFNGQTLDVNIEESKRPALNEDHLRDAVKHIYGPHIAVLVVDWQRIRPRDRGFQVH